MKVLYITHLTERNGATIALRNIMKGMIERGVEIGIVVPNTEGFVCDEARRLGVKILHNYPYPWAMIKGKIFLREYLTAHWKTYQLIKAFKPDIVHCDSGIIDYSLLGCLLTRTPMVWHLREYVDKDFGHSFFGGLWWHKRLLKLPFVHCIAITEGVFNHFSLQEPKDKVIYDGVIDDNIDLSTLDVTTNTAKYFLFVGSFIEGKGAHVIFEQFGQIHREFPDVELWLACSYSEASDYYKRCMSLARQGKFEDKVRFLGFRTDTHALMHYALATIVPSRFEGFGFVATEAMYNSCLVIGRNTAGTKEQFDRGLAETGQEIGLRFDQDDQLPILMRRVLEEDFDQMKLLAKQVVSNNYTISLNVDKLLEKYKDIVR